MPLKAADDKSKRLKLLEDLQRSSSLDAFQKNWLHDELRNLKTGIAGEREAAYYLDHYFDKGENHVVLHDLRFVIDDEVTQIDHLVIARGGNLYLLETKNYSCNLIINERGEFTAEYERRRFGIASPIEQSLRHERALRKLLERLDIGGRVQKQLDIHHVVMLHPKAIIERPPAKIFDTRNVIKADQFPSWHQSFVEKSGVGTVFLSALNLRSLDTTRQWGEKLMRQHRPADLLALPDFMKPREAARFAPPAAVAPAAVVVARAPVPSPALTPAPRPAPVQAPMPSPVQQTAEQPPAKKLICAHCGVKLTYVVGQFCWNNSRRFGGLAYCREHQALM